MPTLDHLIETATPMLRGIARYYYRRSWGLRSLSFEDYQQEAYLAAVSVYRHHCVSMDRLMGMTNRAAIYKCQRLWRKELTKVSSAVELSELIAEPFSSSFSLFMTRETVESIRRTLTGLRRQMFDVLISPETTDADYHFCYEMYRENPHRPLQRGELSYLATYFALTRTAVQRELNAMRLEVDDLFVSPPGQPVERHKYKVIRPVIREDIHVRFQTIARRLRRRKR
jgi:hypothetical protein